MKRQLLFSTLALLSFGGSALAANRGGDFAPGGAQQAGYHEAPGAARQVAPVGFFGEVGCGCETPCDCDSVPFEEPGCGVEIDCGCADMSCEGGCGGGSAGGCLTDCCFSGMLGSCDLGEPFALLGESCGYSAGGWLQLGYTSKALPLFNSRADNLQFQQAWLWAEKAIDTSNGFDIGGRIDYVYGTDAPDTQAFGTSPYGWDNSWDNGADYGHALPQLYMEAGYGDLSFKVGHFYTLIGYEVVGAPDNFFYSHAYTMYNSEPFTHTGALGTLAVTDDIKVYGGYTLGWDSGFDDNGDNFLGGISVDVSDDISLIYSCTGGRFNDSNGNSERGYMQSIVADISLTDKLQYIFQTDYLDTQDKFDDGVRNTFDINQYLIYSVSDCLAVGGRFEWYDQEGVYTAYGDDSDIYALTLGVNVKPHANVMIRPEIRWDYDNEEVIGLEDGDKQTTFGIDSIFLF
ncbi:porin [Stieleria sp. TO1_6]|uniref:porin n=1 Tax=Stieleria tagensis TaxID=2956795 RepID=UPI00209BA548|nr:porin [Stieleria tagensis]MCO8121824.1 porin [Stieleria tagensis]